MIDGCDEVCGAAESERSVADRLDLVIGDPLYRPFGIDPAARMAEQERRPGPWLEWSQLTWVNVRLAQKAPEAEAVQYLERLELTRRSAVLMEKLGDLYVAQGKPSSSVWAGQQALKLGPSPQQRVRLMLGLAEKLVALGRDEEADELYEQFLKECPDYPDKLGVQQKALALARKLNKADTARHEQEVRQLNPPPANLPPAAAPTNSTNR